MSYATPLAGSGGSCATLGSTLASPQVAQPTSWNECSSHLRASNVFRYCASIRMFRAAKHIRLAAIDFALRQSRHTRAEARDSLVVDQAHLLPERHQHNDYHSILRRTRRPERFGH